ncbi:Cna B-type domain-containing protein [Eggerthellaceae bacterium zg-893]|nr:Cna B-type domain-containing protein [Eggerthellaceae bacterium zg-893]
MKRTADIAASFVNDKKKRHREMGFFALAAVMVVLCVVVWLHIEGIATTNEAMCGIPEHAHSEACYTVEYTCDSAEDPDHTHTDECTVETLTCDMEEHTHDASCYSNLEADVETPEQWAASTEGANLTGDWASDLVAVAQTQIGYAESDQNFQMGEDGERHGYTRYGAWNDNPYGAWDSLFVGFCLDYADVEVSKVPRESGAYAWTAALQRAGAYTPAAGYTPEAGDIVFFDEDGNGKADHTAVVSYVNSDLAQMSIIEGDVNDAVVEEDRTVGESAVLGYCNIAGMQERAESPDGGVVPINKFDPDNASNTKQNMDGESTDSDEPKKPAATTPEGGTDPATNTNNKVEGETDATGTNGKPVTESGGTTEGGTGAGAGTTEGEGSGATKPTDPAAGQTDKPAEGGTQQPTEGETKLDDKNAGTEGDQPAEGTQQPAVKALEAYVYAPIESFNVPPDFEEPSHALLGLLSISQHSLLGVRPLQDNGSSQAEGEVDFTDYITDATVEVKPGWSQDWTPIGEADSVQVGDDLRLSLSYTLPGKTLDAGHNTIVYQLPSSIKLTQGSAGICKNGDEEIGYYSIGADGQVKVQFNNDYVKQNAEGAPIKGSVTLEMKVQNIAGENESTDIVINDKVTVQVQTRPGQSVRGDIKVEKRAVSVDKQNGKVSYEAVVSTQNGTFSEVTLKDVMDGLHLLDGKLDDIAIKDGSGKPVENATVTPGGKGFTVALPQMAAGSSYVISYTVGIDKDRLENANTVARNTLDASSTDEKNRPIHSNAFVETPINKPVLIKEDVTTWEQKEQEDKVYWQITINGDEKDLSGWTISDELNGVRLEGVKVKVNPAIDGRSTIELPYTIKKAESKRYVLTYAVDLKDLHVKPGQQVKNKAILVPPNDTKDEPPIESEAGSKFVPWFNPLTKKAGQLVENANENTGLLTWTSTISTRPYETIAGPWTFTDKLTGDQYFTQAQIDAVKESVEGAFKKAKVTLRDFEFAPIADPYNSEHFLGFTIKATNDFPANKNVSFSYQSTVDLKSNGAEQTFTNNIAIADKDNNQTSSSDSKTKKPFVQKFDALNEGNSQTSHLYEDLKDGKLSWLIRLNVPETFEGPVNVVDTLPEGLTWSDAELFAKSNGQETKIALSENPSVFELTLDSNKHSCTISLSDDRSLTIGLPEAAVKQLQGKSLDFKVYAKIPSELVKQYGMGDNTIKAFKNEVTVSKGDDDNTPLGSASSEQTIDFTIRPIQKNSGGLNVADKNNTVHYVLRVNEAGENLLPHASTINVVDVLMWNIDPKNPVHANLVADSVRAYRIKEDGTKGDALPVADYPYSYESSYNDKYPGKASYTLNIRVPDNVPLIIEYAYAFVGKENADLGSMQSYNLAYLEGCDRDDAATEKALEGKLVKSSAEAHLVGAKIYKVDASENGKFLPGATFDVYEYDNNAKAYKKLDGVKLETDDKGAARYEFKDNVAYRLIETKAPDGYAVSPEPFEFILISGSGEQVKPDDFAGKEYFPGANIYIENKKEVGNLVVEKRWLDENDNDVTDQTGKPITFQLMRKVIKATSSNGEPLNLGSLQNNASLSSTVFNRYSSQNEIWSQDDFGSMPAGTKVTLKVQKKYVEAAFDMKDSSLAVKLNNQDLQCQKIERWIDKPAYGGAWLVNDFLYTFTVGEGGNTVDIRPTYGNAGDWSVTIVKKELPVGNISEDLEGVYTPGSPNNDGVYTLSKQAGWEKAFEHLPMRETRGGVTYEYAYYVVEQEGRNDLAYIDGNDATDGGRITIVNQPKRIPKVPVEVKKKWVDADGNTTEAPEGAKVEVQLQRYKKPAPVKVTVHSTNSNETRESSFDEAEQGDMVVLYFRHEDSANWLNKDCLSIDGLKAPQIEAITVDGVTSAKVTGELAGSEIVAKYTAGGAVLIFDHGECMSEKQRTWEPCGEPYELSAGNQWKHAFVDLPSGVWEGDVFRGYQYRVVETEGPIGYACESSHPDGVAEGLVTLTNKEIRKVQVAVEKKWTDTNGNAIDAPDETVKVQLMQAKKSGPVTLSMTDSNGTTYVENAPLDGIGVGDEVILHFKGGAWIPSITSVSGLSSQANPEEYTGSDGIKYCKIRGVVSDSSIGVKHDNWQTNLVFDHVECVKPASGGDWEPYKDQPYNVPVELKASEGWQYTFENLPQGYYEGDTFKEYQYKVVETEGPIGYVCENSHPDGVPSGETVTLTNVKDLNTTNITVQKKWESDKGEDLTGKYTGSAKFELYQVPTEAVGDVWFQYKLDAPKSNEHVETGMVKVGKGKLRFSITEWNSFWRYSSVPHKDGSRWRMWFNGQPLSEKSCVKDSWYLYPLLKKYTYELELTQKENVLEIDTDSYLVESDDKGRSFGSLVGPEFISDGGKTLPAKPMTINGKSQFSLDKTNNWEKVFDGLPLAGKENGVDVTYKYYVKEVDTAKMHQITYEAGGQTDTFKPEAFENENQHSAAITAGDVTITNAVDETVQEYELPQTGGVGSIPFGAAGGLLVGAAIALGIACRRRFGRLGERRSE